MFLITFLHSTFMQLVSPSVFGMWTSWNICPYLLGLSRAEWFSTQAKVAVAVALIRNRPPGMSGRQYAEALGCRLRSQDEGWKKKAEELQREVLRLRQEALIATATCASKSSTQVAGRPSSRVSSLKSEWLISIINKEFLIWIKSCRNAAYLQSLLLKLYMAHLYALSFFPHLLPIIPLLCGRPVAACWFSPGAMTGLNDDIIHFPYLNESWFPAEAPSFCHLTDCCI